MSYLGYGLAGQGVSFDIALNLTSAHQRIPVGLVARAIRITNESSANVLVNDFISTSPYSVPPGARTTINFPGDRFQLEAWTDANATGNATITVSDSPLDTAGDTATQAPPNNQTINISGSVSISSIAVGQSINIASIAAGQSINIGTMPNVTVAAGIINVQNVPGGFVAVGAANPVESYNLLDNQTVTITFTRQSGGVQIQPVLSTLARGGLLTVTAQDPTTTRSFSLLNNESYQQSGVSWLTPIIPYWFPLPLPSGAILSVTFTGKMGFLVGY